MTEKFDPLTGELMPTGSASIAGSPVATNLLSASDIALMAGMTREELLALAKRMACQCGLVAAMTREETAQAMLDVLAETALKSNPNDSWMKVDIESRMRAIDRWLDREKGKPAHTISGEINVINTLAIRLDAAMKVIDG